MAYMYKVKENEIKHFNKNHPTVSGEKLGRNDPCHCGSGIKYKKCCMDATYKPIACVKSI